MRRRDLPAALIASATGAAASPGSPQSVPVAAADVRQFGVVGDRTTDDTDAMLRAISSGQPLDIGSLRIRLTRRLIFNINDQHVYGRGGALVYDGPPTGRLLDIQAQGVRFYHLKFDGNARQVQACLIYVNSNAARPAFTSCWFTDINGTHLGGVTSNNSNSQYALMISPYGVAGFEIADCTFDEIYNDNSGANGTLPMAGLGVAGGIFFLTDDFRQPASRQAIPTSGRIHDCLFRNIRTILGRGLSLADSIEFQDAEGIRFYGDNATGHTALHVSVHDCVFYDCSKRAIKGSVARGVKVSNITVIATEALQYPMVTAVKVDGDDFQLRGMNVYSPVSAPIRIVIQSHDGSNLCVADVFADRCAQFWAITPTAASVVLAGWRVSNLRCAAITGFGNGPGCGITCNTLPDHFEDCVFENVDFESDPGSHSLAAACFVANTPRMEIVLKNWRICNGDLKIQGYGYLLDNVYQELNDTSYASSAPSRGCFEAGQAAGTHTARDSLVHGYILNIKAITADYLATGRRCFAAVYGDRTKVSQFRMWVADSHDTRFAHAHFDGSDFTLDDIEYSGAGSVYINSFSGGQKRRMTVNGARRIGGTASSVSFLYLHLSQDCTLSNICDYRMTNAASITVQSGSISSGRTYAYILDGIRSLSSAPEVISDAGNLARQLNVQRF
jgi:hypothetical protein